MAGRPQREQPKRAIQLQLDTQAYSSLLPLLSGEQALRVSYSRLFELVLLLARDEYTTNADRDFVSELCAMKKRRAEEEMRTRLPVPRRSLHVTIDADALGFLDMLASRYRSLLRTRNDTASLILRLFGEYARGAEKTEWIKRRLEEILIKYPVRY